MRRHRASPVAEALANATEAARERFADAMADSIQVAMPEPRELELDLGLARADFVVEGASLSELVTKAEAVLTSWACPPASGSVRYLIDAEPLATPVGSAEPVMWTGRVQAELYPPRRSPTGGPVRVRLA